MPVTKSAKKRLRQNEVRRVSNLRKRRAMKALIKEVRELALSGKKKKAEELLPETYKKIDKAAKAGIIKEKNASRKKQRLTKLVLGSKTEKGDK